MQSIGLCLLNVFFNYQLKVTIARTPTGVYRSTSATSKDIQP